MTNGPELFYETQEEALKDDIRVLGGMKAVGLMLWPELEGVDHGEEKARTKLNDRVSEERRERLSDEQVRMIIRKAREKRGWSAVLCFTCDETGFERPQSRAPADQMADLQREFLAGVRLQDRLVARMERLAGVSSVPPGRR